MSGFKPQIGPALNTNIRAGPSVEAHHPVHGPYTGRNSRERRIKKTLHITVSNGDPRMVIWSSGGHKKNYVKLFKHKGTLFVLVFVLI